MLDRILGKDIALYIRRHRGLIIFSLSLTAISSLFLIIPAYLIQPFVDEGMRSGSDPVVWKIPWITFDPGSWPAWRRTERVLVADISPNALLLILTSIAFLSVLFRAITMYLSALSAAAFSNRGVKSLRADLYDKFLSLPMGFYHGRKSGELIARATSDLTIMQSLIAEVSIGLIEYPLTVAVFICYLLLMDYKITLLVFFLGPLIFGLIWFFGQRVRGLSTLVQNAIAEVTAAYHETLLCLKVIQSFCTEEKEAALGAWAYARRSGLHRSARYPDYRKNILPPYSRRVRLHGLRLFTDLPSDKKSGGSEQQSEDHSGCDRTDFFHYENFARYSGFP